MTPVRVLELRSVWGTGGGPEKTILLGAARTDPAQFDVTVCYLRDARDKVFGIDAWAAKLPVNYVELIERHSFDPAIWPALRRLVRERRIDIVHAHDYKTNLLAAMLLKWDRVPAMSTVHGWTGNSRRERLAYYPLDKQILRVFPRVVAVSEDIRQELIRKGARPASIRTVLNGIDEHAFTRDRSRESSIRSVLGFAADDVVIGSVGRLEPQKRFDLLIDTFAMLSRVHQRLRLVIVGDGSLRQALQQQVERLRLESTCRILGHRTDIVELHHVFDVFVQSSDYEGTPNAVLEAMALETPVVATDVGGTAQLVQTGVDGLIVPPSDLGALTGAIEAVLGNPTAAAARSASARRRVQTDLSFGARMAAVERVYAELAGSGQVHATRAAVET
jgi:glycosyltransferase involved in cell wall biosynthesis